MECLVEIAKLTRKQSVVAFVSAMIDSSISEKDRLRICEWWNKGRKIEEGR